jgi:hypothetical protein
MDGFSVSLTALTAAATTAATTAAGTGDVEVGAVLGRLAAALPGSATAGAAGGLAEQWDAVRRALATAMDTHAVSLADTASSYGDADGAVADAIRGAGQ